MTYSKINNALGWMCGILATTVYILTSDRSLSWWDTGEFIASAYKLEIVHQPGAPLFLMIQNLFSNFALGDESQIAFWMNVGSGVCSGLTIVFLFWTISAIARKMLRVSGEASSQNQVKIFGAALVGALAYSFTDSFWYSAVESEVYAMSSLCTAVVFWIALKWERHADEPGANKWLLVLAFVMGLSIGVHLLNLLTIPAIALLIYFRKTPQVSWKGILKALGIGVFVLGFILWGVIQLSVKLAAYFDLFFVNTLGLPFGSGVLFFVILLVSFLAFGVYYSQKKQKPIMNLAFLSLFFLYFGFSSFNLLLIRAQTNISLNNYSPDNAFDFLSYLSREQYESEPLIKGPTFNSQYIGVNETVSYRKDDAQYAQISGRSTYKFDKEMYFPRVYSNKHADFYREYLGLAEGQDPSFADNLKFFFNYQVGHMYSRYFMWNFVGRQNDSPSQGEYSSGNWISGISFLDELRIPGQTTLTAFFKNDPSRNTYFFLPLILGIIGLAWQSRRSKKDTAIVGLLFFFTGLAIVLYLNQSPLQPRERDYAYVGSFYVFSIWIGLGMIGLTDFLQKKVKLAPKSLAYGSLAICLLAGPFLLVKQNWDDHDRSGRSLTRDLAMNTLKSCEPNAILFTYGDNDAFPLWYLQEVEGIRTDVRVLNYGYLQSDWYVKQSMKAINKAEAIPVGFSYDKVKKGVRDGLRVMDLGIEGYVDVDKALAVMLSDHAGDQIQMQDGTRENVLPTRKLQLKIDKEAVIKHKVLPKEWEEHIPDYMQWEYKQNYVSRAELSLMSILTENNWQRPIYYTQLCPSSLFMGMDKYLASEGLVYKLMPVEVGQPNDQPSLINADKLYANAINAYQWSDLKKLNHFDTDSNVYYENWAFLTTYEEGLKVLVQQGKMDQAKELALKAYDFQPKASSSAKLGYLNATVVDTLVKVKELEKAKLLASKNLDVLDELLNNQLVITSTRNGGFDRMTIGLGVAALDRYKEVLPALGDQQLLAKLQQMDQKYKTAWM